MVENRLVGIKSRGVYEAPAAVALHAAHKELQALVTTRDLDRFARMVSAEYADLVYNGFWFTPLREALDAFVDRVQERVTGAVRLKLLKGDCRIVGRKSPYALYEQPLATDDPGDRFDQVAAAGFVKIFGLPVEISARKAPPAGNRPASLLNLGATKA
jgi:argininosuccinate synthase